MPGLIEALFGVERLEALLNDPAVLANRFAPTRA